MHSTLEKLENNRVALKIEVSAENLQKAIDQGYRRVAQQVNIPGFRKGKAPKSIIQRYVGSEAAFREALDKVIPEAYSLAVKDNAVEPIDHPQIEVEQIEEGQPLLFTATVEVRPEVAIGQYKDLDIKPKEWSVSDADVDAEIENLRKRYSSLEDTDRDVVEAGDLVTMDFVGKIEDEPFEGGTAEDFQLEIGSGTLIPGFEDQLIGAKIGEAKVVTVTFPEDYPNTDLAGTEANFDVTIRTIKARVLPELNDEFAKKCGPFESVEQLRADLLTKLTEAAENRAKARFDDEVLNTIVDNSSVDIPEVLVERRIDALVNDLSRQLSYQKRTLEDYYEATGTDVAQLRENLRARAERETKMDLVLDAITKQEGVEAATEDFDSRFAEMAQRFGTDEARIRESFKTDDALEGLKDRIVREKTVSLLVDGYEKAVKAG